MKKNCQRHWTALAMIIVAMCCSLNSFSQEKIKITGTVIDSSGGGPLPGVSVLVQGTNTGAHTDADGHYELSASPNAVLIFAYVGFSKRTVTVNGRTNISIRLALADEKLSEVVVVAYGIQKKISVTGAIASIDAKEIKQSSAANMTAVLAGRLPGLIAIQSGGGQPGRDDATMYLRGAATLNGQNPLVLIDGVPRDNIRAIDPNEVATITVLKDASATAVFGVRGANGVILITTKRGQPGKAELNLSVDQSYSAFTREPERLHSLEYMALRNEAAKNDGVTTPPFSQAVMDKFANPLAGLDPNDPDYEQKAALRRYMYPDHDYYREFISRYSPQTRVNMNINGGTDKVAYFVNGSYLHQGGNLKTEPESVLGYDPFVKMDRYSFRSNLDYKITPSLKAILNIGSYIEKANMPAVGGMYGGSVDWMISDLIYQAQTVLPITPGPTTLDGFGVPAGQIVDPGYLDRSAFEIMNRRGFRNDLRSNLNTTLGLEWDLGKIITPGLSIKGMMSYDSRSSTTLEGYKSERLYLAQINYETDQLNYALKRSGEEPLSITKTAASRYNINMQGGLNYNRTFGGKHEVGGMILTQRDYWEGDNGDIPFNVVSLAARATYAYDNRYLAEVNFGYNGSEQFSLTKRYGSFPAASVGWIISNEQFLKDNSFVTNLKLRASYGKVGNDKIGGARFLYQSDINIGGGGLGSLGAPGSNGQVVNQGLLGNPNVTWEEAKKQNYGVDMELMKSLSLSFDYFLENRSSILIERGTIPQLQGTPLKYIPKVNMGVVDNKGFEIELSYRKQFNKNLHLMVKGNYGYNHNVVKFVDEAISDESYVYRYSATGFPIGQARGYKIDYSNGNGFFNSQEELDKYLEHTTYGFGSPRVGDFIYQDLNGDGVVDAKDIAPIKNSNIPGVIYGATASVGFKGFDLTVFFQGVGKYSTYYANQGVNEYTIQGTYFGYHKTAWTPERYAAGEKITYPALSTHSNTNHVPNDFFIMDRSFVRLKNIELAYTLPPKSLQRIGIKLLRVYVSGQNVFTWDKLKMDHLDPENNASLGYPVTKMVNFGCNVTF
jgi:TonB-linked SusC/RagA family outer membrane protein